MVRVLLFLALFISCKEKKKETSTSAAMGMQQQTLPVETMIAKTKSLSSNIEIPGTILPNESTEIHPEVSGRVIQLNVREGAFVGKGALLAKLYDGDLQAQKRKLEVQLKIAEQTENRQAQLLKIQGISQQDYDKIVLTEEISVIGYITDKEAGANIITKGGNTHPITAQGWNAFT